MKIEWTEPSISDLQHIRDYIAKDSEYFAARFIEKIIYRIDIFPFFYFINLFSCMPSDCCPLLPGHCLCLPCGMLAQPAQWNAFVIYIPSG